MPLWGYVSAALFLRPYVLSCLLCDLMTVFEENCFPLWSLQFLFINSCRFPNHSIVNSIVKNNTAGSLISKNPFFFLNKLNKLPTKKAKLQKTDIFFRFYYHHTLATYPIILRTKLPINIWAKNFLNYSKLIIVHETSNKWVNILNL